MIPGLSSGCDYITNSSKSSHTAASHQTPFGCSLVQSVPSGICLISVEGEPEGLHLRYAGPQSVLLFPRPFSSSLLARRPLQRDSCLVRLWGNYMSQCLLLGGCHQKTDFQPGWDRDVSAVPSLLRVVASLSRKACACDGKEGTLIPFCSPAAQEL